MSHQDHVRKSVEGSHAFDLWSVSQWLTTDIQWASVTLRGDCWWTPATLVAAALLWAWSDQRPLLERYYDASQIIMYLFGAGGGKSPSYQAFIKVLTRWTPRLLIELQAAFRRRMQRQRHDLWLIAGWAVFACDGSRIDVPRTLQNQQRYSPSKRKRRKLNRRGASQRSRDRKAEAPHIWLTTLWHVGWGLPWDWREGPSDSSERDHLLAMLSGLPPRSLITADAGFVGYDTWSAIIAAGHHLLVRVGSNVRLLRGLGQTRVHDGVVFLWPDTAARRGQPPLMLRLIELHGGRSPVYLVTTILSARLLSDRQAGAIYARRWGIELFYRHCKQTFERRKLRSHNPDHARIELQWSLLGFWAMGLYAHTQISGRAPPARISFAGVLRAFRRPLRDYRRRPGDGERMNDLLQHALLDDYERVDKTSRDYPRKKQHDAIGPPQILQATKAQRQLAQPLLASSIKKRLTA